MRRRMILSLALVAATAGSALAAEEKAADVTAGLYLDLAQVALPIVVGGRLFNYVFVQVRLNLAPGTNSAALRAKEPYFRDALVRAAHRTPFVLPGDGNRIDEAALKRALMVEAARIAGPRAVASVQVMSQTPKKRVSLK